MPNILQLAITQPFYLVILIFLCEPMETYIDVFLNTDGERASVIHKKLIEMGLKPTIGEHDFFYNWKGIVTLEEEIKFIDKVQSNLKGTRAILRFTTLR